jgi:hypothetical protein
MEGRGRGIMSKDFPGGTEENHEKLRIAGLGAKI